MPSLYHLISGGGYASSFASSRKGSPMVIFASLKHLRNLGRCGFSVRASIREAFGFF